MFFDIRGLKKVKFWKFIVTKNTVKFVEVRQRGGGRENGILSPSTMTCFNESRFYNLSGISDCKDKKTERILAIDSKFIVFFSFTTFWDKFLVH